MLNFISTLGPDKNKLMKAIELDAKDKLIIAGVRAMGILERQITTPLMKLMVKKNITAIDVSYYYTILHSLIKTWSSDPSELLDGSSCLFNNIQPVKDYVYDSLYMNVEEDIQSLTYQALSVGCISFLVVTERMLKDHLPGGRFHCPSAIIIQETSGVPKHNIATERLFSGLDRLIHKMPNANTIGIEGILLWSLNKSVDYLDSLSPAERERLIGKARSAAPAMLVKYRERKRLIKQKRKEKVNERAEKQAAKENQAIHNRLSIIHKVNNFDPILTQCLSLSEPSLHSYR
ncbi:uncharacterized protein LOC125372575 [Haliotis rufescens]|uniref:uncharacterized protein LOC125372575 n=1 Tax=Haliotis rufescens TaxID=6454 RepID=UPI00201EDC8B|nr:uncharacterized protein LOC125372575 [Haliotis rufescens]